MRKPQRFLAVALATVLIVPLAAATWYGEGTYEPDTTQDATGGWMFTEPDTNLSGLRIYFDAFQTEYLTSANPNSGTLGSNVLAPFLLWYNALLGVWKDCNGDGYIGMAEGAVREYRWELLPDESICPQGTIFNDGQWIFEYHAIGPWGGENNTVNPNVITANDTFVWGDWGLPGDEPGTSCPLAPLPHGTTSGTGAMIRYADCLLNFRITEVVTLVDTQTGLGIGFEDPKNPQQSDSPLNQHFPINLFGNPTTGKTGLLQLDSEEDGGEEERAFTAWDCAERSHEVRDSTGLAPRNVSMDDPTGGEADGDDNDGKISQEFTDESGAYASVATPAPATHDPTNSYADGLNQTVRGIQVAGDGDFVDQGVGGDCTEDGANDYGSAHRTVFFYADGDFEGTAQAPAKNAADTTFEFYDGAKTGNREKELFGERTPRNLGVMPTALSGYDGPRWDADVIWVTNPQTINDGDLQPTGAIHKTFYASVNATVLADMGLLTPAGAGEYGVENCVDDIGAGAGIQKGWVCDPDLWYLDPTGKDISDPDGHEARVGWPYHLRDVDCYDGEVIRGSGLYASLVLASDEGPCDRPPLLG